MKVAWLGNVWPEVTSSAAGARTWKMLEAMHSAGWDVTFASSAVRNEHTARLSSLDIKTQAIQPNDKAFDTWIEELDPNIVLFDRFMTEEQFSWRVREHAPTALRVLDTVDLHSLRRDREADLKARGDEEKGPEEPSDALLRELAAILRSDLTFVVSEFERDLLAKQYSIARERLEIVSLFYDLPVDRGKPMSARSHFVTIGNFRHLPNADSVGWLKAEIWPAIRQKLSQGGHNAELHVFGAYPSREMMALTDERNGFKVLGFTPDSAVSILGGYRVSLAALRFGAGVKGKIADSWAGGTPVVTTPIGAEGMGEFSTNPSFSVQDFAEQAVRLYLDQPTWQFAQQEGFNNLTRLFDAHAQSTHLLEALTTAYRSLVSSRKSNIISQILFHETNASLKHLSRWIQLKNEIRARADTSE